MYHSVMAFRFDVECKTCKEGESFDDYHEANRYWADHADNGHDVELRNRTGKVAADHYLPAE